MMHRLLGAVLAAASFVPGMAEAAIVSGEIRGGSVKKDGAFVQWTEIAGRAVGHDFFDDPNFYGFDEGPGVKVGRAFALDEGRDLAVGDVVASHYFVFDPKRGTLNARIRFDAPIVGVATSSAALSATDFLVDTGVTYLSPRARGLEKNDWLRTDPKEPTVLLVSLKASSPGDVLRVFTEATLETAFDDNDDVLATPLPPALALFAAGILSLTGLRRLRTVF